MLFEAVSRISTIQSAINTRNLSLLTGYFHMVAICSLNYQVEVIKHLIIKQYCPRYNFLISKRKGKSRGQLLLIFSAALPGQLLALDGKVWYSPL